jgi:hypothetical protein
MLRSFNPKYMLFWRVRNIAFRRALSTEQYQSALIVGLLCWPLNRMPCLPELYYSADCGVPLQELALSNRVRLVRVPGHCGVHGNEEVDALARAGSNSAFVGSRFVFRRYPRVSSWRSGNGYLNHTAPHGAWRPILGIEEYAGQIHCDSLFRFFCRKK